MSNPVPFRRFGTMIDCSRNAVMNLPTLKKWVDILADFGYNTLLLYTEDTYEVDNQPYFGHLRGRYSQAELREIDAYAAKKGIEVIPCIQTLAHLNAIFQWGCYRDVCDCNDILLAEYDKTYALIEDMFATLAKTFRSKQVNIGMDEAHMLGRGKYLDLNGLKDRSQLLVDHLVRVAGIAKKYGLELTMWGDMFVRLVSGGNYYADVKISEDVKKKIPDNVNLIYWDYYSTDYNRYNSQIKIHNAIKEDCWFAGGLWSWMGFAPHNDYSMCATKAALQACVDNGVKDVFLTMWGDDGGECSKFSLLPSLYYAIEIAKGNTDMEAIKAGFAEKCGIAFDDFMLLDLPGTPGREDGIKNPDKYLLYNDCFMGKFDATVREGDAASFAAAAEKLKAVEEHTPYGYLFASMRALCEVLALKTDLGLRARAAYAAGDKAALAALVADYAETEKRVDAFYEAYRTQWMRENKPHGFDVQDIRLGGLARRVRSCRERLLQYLDGKLARIEELEEPMLHHSGNPDAPSGPASFNSWGSNASANVISW